MILKREVKKFGRGSAHIIAPKELRGKEVYVVSDEDIQSLKELIEKTLLLRKADKFEGNQLKKDYKDFKREVRSRLTALEVVYKKPAS